MLYKIDYKFYVCILKMDLFGPQILLDGNSLNFFQHVEHT